MSNQDETTTESSAAPEAAAKTEALVETPEQKVARLERERAETHDRLLRTAADFENYKKRARRDAEDAAIRSKEQLLKEILPVVDNLERAIVATERGGSLESLAQGVKLVDKQLHNALEKFGIKGFDAKGQPFDPARHEAIQQVETDQTPAGAVAEVFARGYMIGDRLLRPAMVAVAKAPAKPETAAASDGDGKADG